MRIELKIENFDRLSDGGPLTFSAVDRGFEIGRDAFRDWTLPDPDCYISSRHCEVRYEDGGFVLIDLSRNGTFLNGSRERMKDACRLASGDRFQIGDYIVAVEIAGSSGADAEQGNVRTPAIENIWDIAGPAPEPVERRSFLPDRGGVRAPDFSQEHFDLPEMRPAPWLDPGEGDPPHPRPPGLARPQPGAGAPSARPTPHPPAEDPSPFAADAQAGQDSAQPRPRPGAAAPFGGGAFEPDAVPAWDRSDSEPFDVVPHRPVPSRALEAAGRAPAQPQPVPTPPVGDWRAAFAAASGLAPADIAARPDGELARDIGLVLRRATEGLARLLKVRASAKAMTRSGSRTMISASGNNPLKFAPTPQDAMKLMLGGGAAGYLGAAESVGEAFADLERHELATYTAMQKALARLLEDLSPEAIEARLPRSVLGPRKARAWEIFVARWEAKAERSDNGMLDVFLAHFREAYDEASRRDDADPGH